MDIQKIKKKIHQGEIAPVYVFYGDQKLPVEETLKELSEQVVDEASVDFNQETFDLREQPIQAAVEAAETLPFMGEKRLVIASPADFLTSSRSKTQVEHHLQSLEDYVENPAPYSVLVLLSEADKLDQRKKIVKRLRNRAVLASSSSSKDEHLVLWVKERAEDHGVHIEAEAMDMLLQFVGNNMHMLDGEIRKMAQYVGQNETINVQVVQDMTAKTIEQNVFTLVDHVVQLRMAQAFETLHELLKRNEEPIKILFLLARQFRIIYRAKILNKQGYSGKQMSQMLKVHPYACKLAVGQGRNFSEGQLTNILEQLAELDYQMKTGQLEKVLALELFLLRLGEKKSDIGSQRKTSRV